MTKREHRALNYDVLRDRRQPPALPLLVLVLGIVGLGAALVFIGVGVKSAVNAGSEAPIPTLANLPTQTMTVLPTDTTAPTLTPTPSDTPSPDSWGMTGTALLQATASWTSTPAPSLDYCWWLTPSPTPTATLPITPDSWGATGTAIYLATNPPQTPTPEPRRELCLDVPTWTPGPSVTASLTSLPLYPVEGAVTLSSQDMTATQRAWPTPGQLPTFSPPTDAPTPVVIVREVQAPAPAPVVVTSEPVVITSAPIVIQLPAQPITIIITATFAPTWTPNPTSTATATDTETPTPTSTDTDVPTSTPTDTGTPTPTETFTDVPTATPTETLTPTQDVTPESTVAA